MISFEKEHANIGNSHGNANNISELALSKLTSDVRDGS
jgi:hypothetical protein